ncbi:MAG: hypothetical protein WKF84_06255 [Pyrinomonadaceae bacterium]
MLIGEPGGGKNSDQAEAALAQRIINGDVPESPKNHQLISLDMGSLIGRGKNTGENLKTDLGPYLRKQWTLKLRLCRRYRRTAHRCWHWRHAARSDGCGKFAQTAAGAGRIASRIGATTLDEYASTLKKMRL